MLKRDLCLAAMAVLVLACGIGRGDVVTGLEGYWPLDGDGRDFSGNERHGTPIGGTDTKASLGLPGHSQPGFRRPLPQTRRF